jgi:hypothetical protein
VNKDRYAPARLLSGRKDLSVLEKEDILEDVLEQTTGQRTSRGWYSPRVLAWAAAAVIALALVPVLIHGLSTPDEFRSRGSASESGEFRVTCLGEKGACRPGDKLFFQVRPPAQKPYLSAFAERIIDGTIIWYIPGSGAQKSISVPEHSQDGVLTTGIELGDEHPPGRYKVYGLFSSRPLGKEEIRALIENEDAEERHLIMQTFFIVEVQ